MIVLHKTQQAETTKFESWNFWQPRELAVGRLGIFCSQNRYPIPPETLRNLESEGCACFLCVEILFRILLIWCERDMDCIFEIFIFVWTFTSKVKDRIQKNYPTSRSSYFICIPIESMYCIFTIIYHIQPNVGTYIIHGSYGIDLTPLLETRAHRHHPLRPEMCRVKREACCLGSSVSQRWWERRWSTNPNCISSQSNTFAIIVFHTVNSIVKITQLKRIIFQTSIFGFNIWIFQGLVVAA